MVHASLPANLFQCLPVINNNVLSGWENVDEVVLSILDNIEVPIRYDVEKYVE